MSEAMPCLGCGAPTFVAYHYATDAPATFDVIPSFGYEMMGGGFFRETTTAALYRIHICPKPVRSDT